MTLGIGSFCMASSIAFCKPSLSTAPFCVTSKNKASFLPSICLVSCETAASSKPMPFKRLIRAGVALPFASKPTLTGISFCEICLSLACASMEVMCAAKRRGVAKEVTMELSVDKPCNFNVSNKVLLNDSPSFLSAFGGNSSTNSSISKFCCDMIKQPSYLFLVFLYQALLILHQPSLSVPLGSQV